MLEMKVGSELQTIQFLGRVHAFKPLAPPICTLLPNTVWNISMQVPFPTLRSEDRSRRCVWKTRLSESSETGSAHEHHRLCSGGGTRPPPGSFRLPAYRQEQHAGCAFMRIGFVDPVLSGVGDMTAGSGEVLPDSIPVLSAIRETIFRQAACEPCCSASCSPI